MTQLPPDKLVSMAREAGILARKLYDEREIKYGNLWAAMKSYKDAETSLETIEPKPDFYSQILTGLTDCKNDIQQRYDDQNFRAERSIKLGEWAEAQKALQVVLELIPDSDDARNKDAKKKLLDVERRLSTKK